MGLNVRNYFSRHMFRGPVHVQRVKKVQVARTNMRMLSFWVLINEIN